MEKVRYIPEPVRQQLDDAIYDLDGQENQDMRAIYVLLRETGWRGADVLNLRYGNCLDYRWNALEKKYVSYLCGEITKTGIPLHKIPIREEVSDMVKGLADQAESKSNEGNNPEGYLFNTYEGRNKGKPLSKVAFVTVIRSLIKQKDIRDGDKNRYHFKVHALRHVFATIMVMNKANLKELSVALGHYDAFFTLNTYTDAKTLTSYGVPEYDDIINEVLPNHKLEIIDCMVKEENMAEIIINAFPNNVA